MNWKESHPINNVIWVNTEDVYANDYNPNRVAPPEMKLLERSIEADGFTQPIVTWKTDKGYEVIDGFHRHLVGKRMKLRQLPIVVINSSNDKRNDRIASTIRHNRARGKHLISEMSNIVAELNKKNWNDKKIAKELGMDQDEVLRLKQITGLSELFKNGCFSKAWE